MGDKSIHLSASLGIGKKPKDGKDGESVKVIETSVTYAISASAMTPPSEPSDWKAEVQKTTDSKPYLWSRTIVKYSGGASTTTFSVSYNGKDGVNGTSFNPKGTATAFYHQADRNTFTEEGIYLVDIYITASSEQKLYVITRKADGSISYTFAEIGDGYNVGGHLYVAQKPGWVDFGDIKGTDGLDGKDGKDAIDIVLSPAKLTFTADANGNPLLTSDNNKSMLTVMRGKQDVSRGITSVTVKGMLCDAVTSIENNNQMIYIRSISKQEVSVTTSEGTVKKYVPATSGSINISFLLDGVRYTASLPFTVDVKTVLGGVYSDNEKFYTHYEEITNGLEDKINQVQDDTNDNLTKLSSRIEETASQIKLEVSKQPYAVRNLLTGSSFRRQGEGPYIDPQIRIERNTGKGGVSCLHIATQYNGSGEGGYLGAFWDSTYAPFAASGIPVPSYSIAGQNIPIQSDTDYTLSCWVKADNTDLTFCIEVFEMAAYNSANRGTAHRKTFTVSQNDTWQLVEFTIHGKDITSPYLAVNFWCNAKTTKPLTDGTYPAVKAYICQPMLDAASQYSGWSLSPSDGDYQGGNLLDSTATLIPSDSSTAGQSTPLLQVADSAINLRSYEGVYSVAHVNNNTGSPIELLRWNVENVIQDNHDYILSFLAKGTGSITTYLYRDGTPRLYVESINGEQPQLSADGAVSILVTSEWKRYWVHYRLRATAQYPNLPDKLLFRVMSGNDISICQPKLEDGARPTSYTERKTDLVDKASLKKAGIEITTDQVKIYGDKVQVVTTTKNEDGTSTDTPTAMFANGKLNASLIDADAIEVKHLWAKSEDGTTKVGYFGNTDIADSKVGNKCYPLWLGANKAGDANFRVSENGEIYSIAGTIGGFIISDSALTSKVNGMGLTLKKNTITFESSDNRSVILGTSQYLSYPYLLSLNDRSTDTLPGSAIQIDTKDRSSENNGAKPSFFAAIQVNVRNATRNYAMVGTGNVVLNGFVAGTKYSELVVDKENTNYNGFLDLIENNVWVIKCTAKNSVVFLPKLDKVRVALGYSASSMAKFRCFMCIISNSKSSSTFELRGRRYDDNNYSSHDYPAFLNYDGTEDYWSMSKGDSACVMLYFDGNDYKAQLLTLSR